MDGKGKLLPAARGIGGPPEFMSESKGAGTVREERRNASVAEDVVEVQAAEFAVDERLLADAVHHGAVITVEHHEE